MDEILIFLQNNYNMYSNIPKYLQIREAIRKLISSGKLYENQIFPTEKELCEVFGVSRMTVRQAMDELVREGLLERRMGEGTIVKSLKLAGRIPGFSGFSDEMALLGKKTHTKVLSTEVLKAPTEIANKLQLSDTDREVIRVLRIRFVDGHPLSYQATYLPYATYNSILEIDLEEISLQSFLTEQLGVTFSKGVETIQAVEAEGYISNLLQIYMGQACFLISRLLFDEQGEPVEYVQTYLRGDKFMFVYQIDGEGN